jgi:hypothetical protein
LLIGLGPVFHSSELPYQLLAVSLLLGHALGYRIGSRLLTPLALLCCLSPLALVGLRAVGSQEVEANSLLALLLGILLAVLSTAALARLTLHWWAQLSGSPQELRQLYSLEMIGSGCGMGLAVLVGPLGMLRLFPWLAALAFGPWPRLRSGALLLAASQSLGLAAAMEGSARQVYGPQSQVLEASYSPYQLVEAVQFEGQPYLYLNGLCHHNPDNLVVLNYYLSTLPAKLLSPQTAGQGALILGGGALLSARETRAVGLDSTVVELDPEVLRIGQKHFAPALGLNPHDPGLHLVCDDARRYTRAPRQYGLIVFSLPYPYSLSVASLFTREYFQHLQTRLAPGGFLTLFLGASAGRGQLDPVAASILRSLRLTFPHTLALSSREMNNTVVLCRNDQPWDIRTVFEQCRRDGYIRFHILKPGRLATLSDLAPPLTLWDLRSCARLNLGLWIP